MTEEDILYEVQRIDATVDSFKRAIELILSQSACGGNHPGSTAENAFWSEAYKRVFEWIVDPQGAVKMAELYQYLQPLAATSNEAKSTKQTIVVDQARVRFADRLHMLAELVKTYVFSDLSLKDELFIAMTGIRQQRRRQFLFLLEKESGRIPSAKLLTLAAEVQDGLDAQKKLVDEFILHGFLARYDEDEVANISYRTTSKVRHYANLISSRAKSVPFM